MSFADRIRAMMARPVKAATKPRLAVGLVVPINTDDEPVDLGKLARQAVRAKRARCAHHQTKTRKKRAVCVDCGDSYPCAGRCEHLDCIELSFKLRIRAGFPRDFSFHLVVLARGHRSGEDCPGCTVAPEDHYEYDVDPVQPPHRWITAIPLEQPR